MLYKDFKCECSWIVSLTKNYESPAGMVQVSKVKTQELLVTALSSRSSTFRYGLRCIQENSTNVQIILDKYRIILYLLFLYLTIHST